MFVVLLSGGSGKRLWPLSNELRSKQYIKLIRKENSDESCSMIQRVWNQIEQSGLGQDTIITASFGQVEIIKSQLGNVNIAIEPDRRDTFPAIALSCAYIKDKLGGQDDDYVCVIPVDPYAESSYFETIKELEIALNISGADIALMGAVPKYATNKYGYIITEKSDGANHFKKVLKFKEKPTLDEAEELIRHGAYWNCGVFCFRIGYILNKLASYDAPQSYDGLYEEYSNLKKISFDYEVLERAQQIVLVEYSGIWEDMGSWDALSQKMSLSEIGKVIKDETTKNTHIINELNIPVVTVGAENLIVVAAFDGILVADKNSSSKLKDVLSKVSLPSMYEERRWGTLKTMDLAETKEGFTLFRKIHIFSGMSSSYHFHNNRDETLTILGGRGEMIIEGITLTLAQGTTLTIPRGKRHAIKSHSNLEYMEIHMGKTIGDDDINRITFDWDSIIKL